MNVRTQVSRYFARYTGLCGLVWLLSAVTAQAEGLLSRLKLDEGKWELAVVSLHNYNPHPLQKELGTFIIRDQSVLRQMQQSWYGRPFYDDVCDFHYSLKFYQDGKLRKTLLLNLSCNYISQGLFSYEFTPELLLQHRDAFEQVPWSNISYGDIQSLRQAMTKIDQHQDYYFYHDVEPYRYDGYFVVKTGPHPLSIDLDSMTQVVAAHIRWLTNSDAFYNRPELVYLDDNDKPVIKHEIFCDEPLAQLFAQRDPRKLVAYWRSHQEWIGRQDNKLPLTVIGINRQRYIQLMRE